MEYAPRTKSGLALKSFKTGGHPCMSGLEPYIIYTAGALLLSITASRFLLQELISLVHLYKRLMAAVRAPLPASLPPGNEAQKSSKDG